MTDTTRKAELKQMLADRRRELRNDLDTRLREGRHGRREQTHDRERQVAKGGGPFALVPDSVSA